MSGIGLLLNPKARRHQRDPGLADRLRGLLGPGDIARSAATLDQLREAARAFREAGVEVLCIGGGDGTNHVTISGLLEVYGDGALPALGLLRGGTMNTVANSFRIPRRRPEALLAAYQLAHARRHTRPPTFVHPHVLRVGDHCGFIFGTGAIQGFIAEYNRREERSPAWAAQVLARAAASALVGGATVKRVVPRWTGEVRFEDGSAFPLRDYLTVGASTCGEIGLGFQPFYRNGEMPGRFHILGIFTSAPRFVQGLPRIWQGQTLGPDRTYEKLTTKAILTSEDGVIRYTLDGDLYEHHGALEVSCGPTLDLMMVDR